MATPEQGGDWGILGGTFDPVHNGHLHLARQIADRASLDGVLFVIAAAHPFKQGKIHAGYDFRRDMLELALAGYDNFLLSEIESDKGLSGYSIDTIAALRSEFPRAVFHFLIGSDNLDKVQTWHRADELLRKVEFLVGVRPPSDRLLVPDALKDHIEAVDIEPLNVSSTQVRSLVAEGCDEESLAALVPKRVAEYILRNGIYQ